MVENIEYDRLTRQIPWGKQAILFRTNIQSRPIEAALRKARVRYRLIGGQSFFDRSEIKDILAYLKTFVNPNDDVNLLRIANKPARGLSDVTMERLLAFSAERKASVYTVMRHTDVLASFQARTRDAITGFAHWIDTIRAPLLQGSPICLSNWADHWLEETGYLTDLRRGEKNQDVADNRVRNIQELLDDLDGELTAEARRKKREATAPKRSAKPVDLENDPEGLLSGMTAAPKPSGPLLPDAAPEYLGKPMDRLDEFLAGVTLDQEREEDKDAAGDQVTLITMHAAKGLEWDAVIVTGLVESVMPHAYARTPAAVAEENRLLFVAMTRARSRLTLTRYQSRRGEECAPSRFLINNALAQQSVPD